MDFFVISNFFSVDQVDIMGIVGVFGGIELIVFGLVNQMIISIFIVMDDVFQIQFKLGVFINCLNDIVNNLISMQDNIEVVIGNIMDIDYVMEVFNMIKQQVLMQIGIIMLKQFNSMFSMVFSLLQ